MFRVLHALSLYFPDTGYVQGMASLAATLLCYFDEEKCFVMLVRMWQLRGLEALYKPGFEGLLAALKDFDGNWLNKEVYEKLVSALFPHNDGASALTKDRLSLVLTILPTARGGTSHSSTYPFRSPRSSASGMYSCLWDQRRRTLA